MLSCWRRPLVKSGIMQKLLSRLRVLSLSILAVWGMTQGASAYNVPGSAQAELPEMTEIATGIIVKSLKTDIRPMRDDATSVQVSTKGGAPVGLSATTGGTTPLSFSLTLRDINTSEIDGAVTVGTLIVGHATNSGPLYFGGLVVETGDIRTSADTGRIRHDGAGLVLGVDYKLSSQFYLTGIVGAMALDYDVSRGGGAVTGSFGADRQFVDLSADYLTRAASGDLRLGFGLLYVHQTNEAYAESGGAAVPGYSFDQLSANFDLRNTWGTAGEMRPYLEVSAQGRIGGSDKGSVLIDPSHLDASARLGLGFEQSSSASHLDLGLGANFSDSSFSGLDAKLSYSLRF